MKKLITLIAMLVLILTITKNTDAKTRHDQKAHFDGVITTQLSIPNSASLNLTGSLSFELWVKTENVSAPVTQMLLEKSSGANGYGLFLENGKVLFKTNGSNVLLSSATLQNNQWTHITVTYNSIDDSATIYINGVTDVAVKITGAEPTSNVADLKIGGTANTFKGDLDEIRIWRKELSTSEIMNLFRLSFSGEILDQILIENLTSSSTSQAGELLTALQLTFQNQNGVIPYFSLLDWSGNNNNAINNGVTAVDFSDMPSTTISLNACLNLDGTNYLTGADNPAVSPTNEMTIEVWIKPTSLTGTQTIIHKGPAAGAASYGIKLVNGTLRIIINGQNYDVANIISSGVWQHIVVTVEQDTVDALRIYVNGKLTAEFPVSGPVQDDNDSLSIGGTSAGNYFTGQIDELRIADYAKSAAEIKNQMFLTIDKSNDPNPTGSDVSYCFDGSMYDNCGDGPVLHIEQDTVETIWSAFSAAPVLRADTLNFSEGFYMKRNQKNIPINGTSGTTTDSLIINSSGTISDAELFISIQHEDITDLTISLIAPNLNEVVVYNGDIKLSSEITSIYDDQSPHIWSDDWVSPGPSIKPLNPINNTLTGMNTAGLWRIKIVDNNPSSYPVSTGRLYGWGLRFNNETTTDRVLVTGAISGNGYYATLADALAAINSSSQTGANIIIYIQQDTVDQLTAVLNAGTWASLKIEPVGHRIVSGAMSPGSPLIDINGADNVTIDGLNTGGNSLTISNTIVSTNTNTSTIRFINDATNNTITNCKILGSSNSAVGTNAGNILFSTGSTTGNDNNTISNCIIGPAGSNLPSKGIYFAGTTSSTTLNNSGNSIIGCKLHDYFISNNTSAAVYVKNGSRETTIQNCKFFQTAPRVLTTNSLHTAITIDNNNANGVGFQIIGNTIGFADSSGNGFYEISGASNRFRAIDLNVATSIPTVVQGNTIAGIKEASADGGIDASSPCMGIYIQNGLVNVTNNTIGSMTSTGSIQYTSSSGSQSGFIGIGNYSSGNSVISGNSIGGITMSNTGSAAGIIYCISNNTTSANTFTCSNNIIGGSINNSIRSTTTAATTIVNGIRYTNCSGTVTGNTIRNLTADGGTGTNSSASVIGIRINAGAVTAHNLSQNTIHTLKNTNPTSAAAVTGIHSQINSSAPITIERNLIHSFVVSGNDGVEHRMLGIHLQTGTGMIKNNMIRLGIDGQGNGVNHGARIIGINEDGTNNQIVFNSVYIGGNPNSASDSVSTYAFYSDVTVNPRTFRNNIFYNARSNNGASGKHFAIRVGGSNPEPDGLDIGNNVYLADGNGGLLGFFNSSIRNDLSAWEQGLQKDSTSFERDPKFLNPAGNISSFNLHINPNVPTIIESNGSDIPLVTEDFDGEDRDTLTKVDIGADAGDFIAEIPGIIRIKMYIEGFYNVSANSQSSDTVTIELREAISPYNILQSEVTIVDADGNITFLKEAMADGSIYTVLKHRNSIETWSAVPVIINEDDTTYYDFTTAASQAYGNNMKQVDASPVTFAMFGGDVNIDGTIDVKDMIAVYNDIINGVSGYVQTDVTGDDFPDVTDLLIVYNNGINVVTVITP